MVRELLFSVTLADCDVQTFSVGGAGGQRRDKKSTGVRIVHNESGAVGQATEQRSQLQNKKLAFKRMVESKKFQTWLRIKQGKEALLEVAVEQSMTPDKIKTEVRQNGKWVEQ